LNSLYIPSDSRTVVAVLGTVALAPSVVFRPLISFAARSQGFAGAFAEPWPSTSTLKESC